MGAYVLHTLGLGLLAAAFLHSHQCAGAGWNEHAGRDMRYDGSMVGFPTTAPYPMYAQGDAVKLDETVTYGGPDWFRHQGSLTQGGGITVFADDYSISPVKPSKKPSHSGPPGSSLLSLADVLRKASPQLRRGLLRHFSISMARLKTRLIGLGRTESGIEKPSKAGSEKQESQAATERRINALVFKINGLVGAAEGPSGSQETLAKFMLLPFERLLQEAEELLSDIAVLGDAELMITALSRLAPPLMRGLSYLEAPQSQEASGVLEPARRSCLKRVNEMDKVLLEAQADLEGVLLAYPRDFDKNELQREKELAALEGGTDHELYIPPVALQGMPLSADRDKIRRRLKATAVLFGCLLLFTAYASIAVLPPAVPMNSKKKSKTGRSRHRGRWGEYGGTESGSSAADEAMDWASREAPGAQQDAFREQWMHEHGQAYPGGYTVQNGGWGPQGFHHGPTFQAAAYGPQAHPSFPAYGHFPPYQEEQRVTPSAPPMPSHFEHPDFPPPSYEEVMGWP